MPTSRLGVYFIGQPDVDWIEKAKPPVAFQLLTGNGIDVGRLRAAMQASPRTLWVLRLYAEDQNGNRADAFNQDLLRAIEPFQDLAPWAMGYNEIATNTPEAMALWAQIEVTRTRLLHKNGYRSAGGSFAVGNPPLPSENPAIWTAAFPMLDTQSPDSLDALILHEYGYPSMASDDGWECNRYRKVYEWLPARYRKRLIIGECGIDKGSRPPKDGSCGWKAVTSPAEYMAQLAWYDGGLPKDALAAVYCWGYNGDEQWNSFRIDDSPVAGLLSDYLAANPPIYWKGETNMSDPLVDLLTAEFGAEFDDPRLALPTNPAAGAYRARPLDGIKYLVIHHSVTPPDISSTAIAQYHCTADPTRNKEAWPGIAYHFLVYGIPGRFYKVRYVGDLDTNRYHVGNFNSVSAGICLVGNFMTVMPDDHMLDLTKRLCDLLDKYLGRKVQRLSHRDLDPTDQCPGDTWPQWKDKIMATEVITPDAARIAELEAQLAASTAQVAMLQSELADSAMQLSAANEKITKAKAALL